MPIRSVLRTFGYAKFLSPLPQAAQVPSNSSPQIEEERDFAADLHLLCSTLEIFLFGLNPSFVAVPIIFPAKQAVSGRRRGAAEWLAGVKAELSSAKLKGHTVNGAQTGSWNMVTLLLALLNSAKWKGVWAAHVAFAAAVARLAEIKTEIDFCSKCQAIKDGAVEEKAQALQSLGDVAFEVAAGVKAYASANNDKFLAGKVKYSRSAVTRGSGEKVIARTGTILDAASETIDSLGEQRITPAKLKALEKAIEAYTEAHPKPRQATGRSNGATRRLPELFSSANEVLKDELDGLAVQFKKAEPAFYAEYQAARKIVSVTGKSGAESNVVPAPNAEPATKAA